MESLKNILELIFNIVLVISFYFLPVFLVWNFKYRGFFYSLIRGMFWLYVFLGMYRATMGTLLERRIFIGAFVLGVLSYVPVSKWRTRRIII